MKWRRREREVEPAEDAGLEQIAASERLVRERRAPRAGAPLSADERQAAAERIAAQGAAVRSQARVCPTCASPLRDVVEHGVATAWCPGCAGYVGPDPRAAGAAGAAGGAVVFGYAEYGPDADGDGDVDGGVVDGLDGLLG